MFPDCEFDKAVCSRSEMRNQKTADVTHDRLCRHHSGFLNLFDVCLKIPLHEISQYGGNLGRVREGR